eukprot:3231819-Pleurochrysis_carterae.AAC.2
MHACTHAQKYAHARASAHTLNALSVIRQGCACGTYRTQTSSLSAHARRAFLGWACVPGDVVFVPRGWWHSTLALSTCVAYTENLVLRHDAKHALRALAEEPAQAAAAARIRQCLAERHSDS